MVKSFNKSFNKSCRRYTNSEFTHYAIDRYLNMELQLCLLIKGVARLDVVLRIRDVSLMIKKFHAASSPVFARYDSSNKVGLIKAEMCDIKIP